MLPISKNYLITSNLCIVLHNFIKFFYIPYVLFKKVFFHLRSSEHFLMGLACPHARSFPRAPAHAGTMEHMGVGVWITAKHSSSTLCDLR